MASIQSHAPGSFCWFELGTTDQNAAKQFYGALFGWVAADAEMAPGEFYTMFKLEDRDAAAGYTLSKEIQARGVGPRWMLYIAVESADQTAAKVAGLGGTVLNAPFDVGPFGRMAIIQDPTGATFSIWQPVGHFGTGIKGVDGTVCWADLSTPDRETAAAFYSGLFGWELKTGENDPTGYLHIVNAGEAIGGMPPPVFRDPNAPPHWLLYFYTSDCDAATAKAAGMGAHVYMPPMTVPEVGRWSVVADPQGAAFALFQDKSKL